MDKITSQQLRHMLQLGGQPLLLDVRDPYELKVSPGSIEGVLNIPLAKLEERLGELQPYTASQIIIICRSGARAIMAAGLLAEHGFENVSVLEGGMEAWHKG